MHRLMRNTRSNHAEFHPSRFADHVLIPGRIPNELDIGLIYSVDRQNFALRIVRDRRSHPATGSSQSHFHFHFGAAFWFIDQSAVVNKPKIDNVHWDLWVVALSKLVPHSFF